jgi:hypothetical protein
MVEATVDGVLSERWDDDSRTYRRFDPSGAVLEERPFNEEENAHADVRAAAKAEVDTALSLKEQARASIEQLLASIDSLQAITALPNNQITPNHTKDVARETRRVARTLVAITRIVADALDSDDIGD